MMLHLFMKKYPRHWAALSTRNLQHQFTKFKYSIETGQAHLQALEVVINNRHDKEVQSILNTLWSIESPSARCSFRFIIKNKHYAELT